MAVFLSESVCITHTSRAAVRARKADMTEIKCPPCNANCNQGRDFDDITGHMNGDADGLGALRGLAVALAIVGAVIAVVIVLPIVVDLLH